MPSVRRPLALVRTPPALRTTLLLLLALVCGACGLAVPSGPASPGSAPQLQQPRVQQSAPAAAYESAHTGGGEADAPRGSVLHGDRRRAVPTPAGAPGPQPLVTRAAGPFTDPASGRTGGPDSRPRPLAAHDSSALQVFRC
ncbi:hypothetical protein [Streptomyces sp. NPDC085479]|uniref:hypothetical protein n=1 Tax=Streptomyces sp. NPDC085479 TaxID=3365726 RepID=UPI0037CE1F4E